MRPLGSSEIILIVIAVIAAIVILGWRYGGPRANRREREAEREREVDDR